MAQAWVVLLATLYCVSAAPAQDNRNISGYTEGDMNGGVWYCPWYLDWFECHPGTFTCTCNNNNRVHFEIGCCYKFPECGVICHSHDCSRWSHCASCRSGIGEWDSNACYSCIPGFALGTGDCKTDIDECSANNGGCEHGCSNSYGSYGCLCNDGFSLNDNRHDCDRLSCEEPGSIEHGTVTAIGDLMYESYVEYDCEDSKHDLVGWHLRRCDATGENTYWQGAAPQCKDGCEAPLGERQACGPAGVDETKCQQLGCCFDTSANQCFFKPGAVYLQYGGERTGSGEGYSTQPQSTVAGCGYLCDHASNANATCGSFLIQARGQDSNYPVQLQDCHLLEHNRNYYKQADDLVQDDSYILYDPLVYSAATTKSWNDERSHLVENLYIGCYAEDDTDKDFSVHAFTDTSDMSGLKCVEGCRNLGYHYAAVQGGTECRCSDVAYRKHGQSTQCVLSCAGDSSQMCGGTGANSVYHVPSDARYLGCYHDSESARDLDVKMWAADAGKPASDCVTACLSSNFKYAGVQDGGACYCGNSYGSHGHSDEGDCFLRCTAGYGHQNCGGHSINAIYRTEKAYDLSAGNVETEAGSLYDSSGRLTAVQTQMFSIYPGVRSLITNKLILHAAVPFQVPREDTFCGGGDCYTPCGEIEHEEGGDKGEVVTLRWFYLRLSNLDNYVGASAKQVYVYAQTVLIDRDIELRYSLLVRARQIIIDRDTASVISVLATAPDLTFSEEDMMRMRYEGPYPEQLQQQQSYMCARILEETREQRYINVAMAILREVSGSPSHSEEQHALQAVVRSHLAEVSGMGRTDLRHVPFYTKSHLAKVLDTYYTEISIYKQEYDRLLDSTTSDADFIAYAEAMQNIYISTDVEEARADFESAVKEVEKSNATYQEMKQQYESARTELDNARIVFEQNILHASEPMQQGLGGYLKGIYNTVYGIINNDWQQVNEGLAQIRNNSRQMVDPMEQLAQVVYEIDLLSRQADEMLQHLENMQNSFDPNVYMDDVEMMVALQVSSVQWQNLQDQSVILLADPEIVQITGSKEYSLALMEVTNWGLAMTQAMVEKAEMTRLAMQHRSTYDLYLEKQARVAALIVAMKQDVTERQRLLHAMVEQTYDVVLDLNELLLEFCRAYFYENLYECGPSYKPSFGGSMSELLLKINAAKRDDLFNPDPPSTVSRITRIRDSDTSAECRDFRVCPINYLKQKRVLVVTLDTQHPDFADLDKYRVAEVVLDFVGAKATSDNTHLKLAVQSAGQFSCKYDGSVYNFLTKPINLAYEYDLTDGHVTIHADVYDSFRQVVHHITPFTTWVFPVSQLRSSDISFQDVTEVKLRLDGSAIAAFKKDSYNSKNHVPIKLYF